MCYSQVRKTQEEKNVPRTNRILFSFHLFTSMTAWRMLLGWNLFTCKAGSGLEERTQEPQVTALTLLFPLDQLVPLFQAAFLKEAGQ